MDGRDWWRLVAGLVVGVGWAVACAAADYPGGGFQSIDQRLPNPDRPYEMTSGTVLFGQLPFALYDLKFEPLNPEQLDIPQWTDEGAIEFDSEFDIKYSAMVSFGKGPVHEVSGPGRAHVVGKAPVGEYFEPQVFQTELLRLDLYALSPIPEVYFRESPTLRSRGLTIREDLCPLCLGPASAAPFSRWRIYSYSDVFGEFSLDGGHTWAPGERPFRVEQAPAFSRRAGDDAPGSEDGSRARRPAATAGAADPRLQNASTFATTSAICDVAHAGSVLLCAAAAVKGGGHTSRGPQLCRVPPVQRTPASCVCASPSSLSPSCPWSASCRWRASFRVRSPGSRADCDCRAPPRGPAYS